jgi:hypothetical protein
MSWEGRAGASRAVDAFDWSRSSVSGGRGFLIRAERADNELARHVEVAAGLPVAPIPLPALGAAAAVLSLVQPLLERLE